MQSTWSQTPDRQIPTREQVGRHTLPTDAVNDAKKKLLQAKPPKNTRKTLRLVDTVPGTTRQTAVIHTILRILNETFSTQMKFNMQRI